MIAEKLCLGVLMGLFVVFFLSARLLEVLANLLPSANFL